MASKSVKRTTITTKTTQHGSSSDAGTPARGAASPGRARAPSPARISRTQEKEELSHLNDRLANYIDKVRFLETENNRLMVQVKQSEETVTREVTSIKSLYESELSDARKLLDETAKDKARLQLEASKYKEEANEWLTKYGRKERALKDAEKKIAGLEAELADLQLRLAEAEKKVKPLEKENNALRADVARLERQLSDTKKQLEAETLTRVDVENRLQSMKEELAFKSQIHEQELNETRTRISTTVEEVDGRIQQDYDAKLADALREMRAHHEEQIALLREEYMTLYETKIADLEAQAKRNSSSASYAREELRTTKRRLDELLSEVTKLRAQNSEYESRIQDLEGQLLREQEEHAMAIRVREDELMRLRQLLDDQSQEYAELLDIKIKLDMEIAAYRKLLEGEEARLNLSSSAESTPHRTPSRSVVRGVKRKRPAVVEEEISQSSSNRGYATSSSAKGGVEVNDTDTEGQFIKLYNNSDKDIPLGGWQIRHVAGEQETTYKFHRSSSIKAGSYVTVWSSHSGQTHSPPSDLVMKGQKWFVDDHMKTLLLNSDGEEMAVRELSKSNLSSVSSYRTSYGGREVEGAQHLERESCAIM